MFYGGSPGTSRVTDGRPGCGRRAGSWEQHRPGLVFLAAGRAAPSPAGSARRRRRVSRHPGLRATRRSVSGPHLQEEPASRASRPRETRPWTQDRHLAGLPGPPNLGAGFLLSLAYSNRPFPQKSRGRWREPESGSLTSTQQPPLANSATLRRASVRKQQARVEIRRLKSQQQSWSALRQIISRRPKSPAHCENRQCQSGAELNCFSFVAVEV